MSTFIAMTREHTISQIPAPTMRTHTQKEKEKEKEKERREGERERGFKGGKERKTKLTLRSAHLQTPILDFHTLHQLYDSPFPHPSY